MTSRAGRAVYRHFVKTRLRRLQALRLDPVKIDWALAALFTVTTQQAIWVAHDGAGHHLGAFALALAITMPVAVRRRWPTLVGTAVPVLSAVDNFAFNGTSIGYPLATFFALYALAVWSTTRRFITGLATVVVAIVVAAIPAGTVAGSAEYLTVVVVVMLFVRRVVGDRERRATLAERERDVAAREAILDERARIA